VPLESPDLARLRETLALAEQAIGLSDPNPRVGCVIAAADGRIVARGSTREAGGPHAEIVALQAARAAGHDVRGGTAWVSLEPCAHHGRTPPCCDALADAGLARVVVAAVDPNPLVAGRGIARLRSAGVAVDVADASQAVARAARELNIGFFSRMKRGRPWVRMKVAASLDGRTALDNGLSQWITGEAARADGHAWRRRASAVLTGVGTVLDDDPRLDVRLVPTARQPLRVVVDSRLQTPPAARIVAPPGGVLLFCAVDDEPRAAALRGRGVEIVRQPNAAGKVDLAALLDALAAREVNELHVEAGHKLNASLLREGLVDELLVYLAPKLLGAGRGIAELGPYQSLAQAVELEFVDVERIGADLRVRARVPGRAAFVDDNA
jgi:diaminohydroxyphosphoribosylaminopyrimidine deaminase/5-amino-6-(5-phosphoribosylamino)uracil reductase